MDQRIGFCQASDGVRIAYATLGEGPPLVYTTGWPGHLELEWEQPFSRAFLEMLADGTTLVRYDMRGSGLSDLDVSDFSLDALVRDLEAVVSHLRLDKLALLGLGFLAGPISITFAARHADVVTHLLFSGGFLRGSEITTPERQHAIIEYVEAFGTPYDLIAMHDMEPAEQVGVREIERAGSSREMRAALLRTLYAADVTELAGALSMPALVMHGRADRSIPFELGRELAARLPQATFVPFEGSGAAPSAVSHIILPEIRRFLGIEVVAPAVASASPQGLVTILFTDVEGSIALTQRLGDDAARAVLREHEQIVRSELKDHGGVEVKALGDGFMASFSSASRALECAIDLQRAFAARARERPEADVQVRAGVNAGEPIAEDDDLFGTAVNLAARIAAQARGGEVLVSDVVRQLVAGKGFLFADRGEAALRGFEEPVRLYELGWQA
ncbi:MAG: adenylate/guanylate cyclase domain-containing protein [Dehalococcoidia bacterium]|nr:adenylate/guanylate cyclase domain-containing protein [Dehalococcoidia bacterium]